MANSFHFLLQVIVCLLWVLDVNTKRDQGEECGHPIGSYSIGKIVGGYDIGYYKYSWYTALKQGDDVFCGGTLISPKFIVTAAHCYQPFFKAVSLGHMTLEQALKPTLGVYNVCRHESTQKEFKVAKVYVHERYVKMDPYFDIALVKLKQEAKGYQPCCLPDKAMNSRTRPKEGYVSGLGDQRYNSQKVTCSMREARILIYNDDICKQMLKKNGEDGEKLQHAFCAGYLEGGVDACQGDSGGPLVIADPPGRFSLLGITSFGFECALPNTLGIYTDVTHFLDWLKEKMRQSDHTSTSPQPSSTTTVTQTSPTNIDFTIPAQNSSGNWDEYPVTPWESVPDSPPPWEDILPPPRPILGPQHPHHYPINIIINVMSKHRKGKNKHGKEPHKKHKAQTTVDRGNGE